MNHWQAFLDSQDALPQNNATAGDAATARTLLIPMREHSLITVEGADAQKFLQGQLTCDLRRLEQCHSLLGAHCNPKGRMISSFLVAGSPDRITLRLRSNIAEPARAALQKYIVFSKARIRQDTRLAVTLLGEAPVAALPCRLPEPGQAHSENDLTLINRGDGHLELWCPAEQLQQHWQRLLQHCKPGSTAQLDLQCVRNGLAEVQAATQDAFLPQMFNYHLLDAISFKKGCYTGQEIVARMQYRGQLKKHTYRAALKPGCDAPVGSEVFDASAPDRPAGVIVASAHTPEACEVLLVCNADSAASTNLYRGGDPSQKVEWLDLPYAIP